MLARMRSRHRSGRPDQKSGQRRSRCRRVRTP